MLETNNNIFYRLHDLNNDKFLDGNELFAALFDADPKGLIRKDSENKTSWDEKEAILSGERTFLTLSFHLP